MRRVCRGEGSWRGSVILFVEATRGLARQTCLDEQRSFSVVLVFVAFVQGEEGEVIPVESDAAIPVHSGRHSRRR